MTGTTATPIVIVGGCGHVGLPLGIVLAESGCDVHLLDINAATVSTVNSGMMPFTEAGAEARLRRVIGTRLRATTDESCLAETEIAITVVGTPVDDHLNPTVKHFYSVVDSILNRVRDGALIILRSTLYPGVSKLVQDRIAALGRSVEVAYCPERIAENHALEELRSLPQIVSAFTPQAYERAAALFLRIAPEVIRLDPMEAELAKLFTNSWRYLNFATSNQFYMLASHHGLDYTRIHEATTRNYPRMRMFARAGFAAGPCLLKDTLQLAAFSGNQFLLGHAAMLVNEGLPNFILLRLRQSVDISTKTVAILGMAFKAESDDGRDSLSYKLKHLLEVQASRVLCTDPYVKDPALVPLETALRDADVLILGAPHAVYKDLAIPPGKVVVDVWGFWKQKDMADIFVAAAPGSRL